jgi:hypothetical protein
MMMITASGVLTEIEFDVFCTYFCSHFQNIPIGEEACTENRPLRRLIRRQIKQHNQDRLNQWK